MVQTNPKQPPNMHEVPCKYWDISTISTGELIPDFWLPSTDAVSFGPDFSIDKIRMQPWLRSTISSYELSLGECDGKTNLLDVCLLVSSF